MAGLGSKLKKPQRVAEQRSEGLTTLTARAPVSTPSVSSASGGLEIPDSPPMGPKRQKSGWYADVELIDEVRDAAKFMQEHGIKIDGARADSSSIAAAGVRAYLADVKRQLRESGLLTADSFPVCEKSKKAQARRLKRTSAD